MCSSGVDVGFSWTRNCASLTTIESAFADDHDPEIEELIVYQRVIRCNNTVAIIAFTISYPGLKSKKDACHRVQSPRSIQISEWPQLPRNRGSRRRSTNRYVYVSLNHVLALLLRRQAGQQNPQKPPYGLYNEKLSGTAFTAPRWENQQTWLRKQYYVKLPTGL